MHEELLGTLGKWIFTKEMRMTVTAAGWEVRLKKVIVKLNNIDEVQRFVSILANCNGDFNLSKGRITVDAKSILGVCSLDLSGPLELWIFEDEAQDVIEKIRPYILAG